MSSEAPKPEKSPEKNELVDDNARKFVVEELNESLLQDTGTVSFVLTTDWLETNEDSETKLAHKAFANGDVQILLIKKVTKNGKRESEKRNITDEEYRELLAGSTLRVQKKRYEFEHVQSGVAFSMKYDVFDRSGLRVLEVDASTDAERALFNANTFPGQITEVTGDLRYYGYRIAKVA